MSSEDDHDVLARTARRLETACSIIQEAHGSLSLEYVVTGIVENLVAVGGLAGAEIAIRAQVENLPIEQNASAGAKCGPELRRHTPIYIRGFEIGTLTAHFKSERLIEEQMDLLEFILPTLFMGIDHAVAYAEVLEYRRTLEMRVEERTAQLAEAHQQLAKTVDDLKEAKSARDRFFANINHEIRTPLTLIQLATDGIARSGDELSANARQKLDEVNAGTRRLLHLVNSLLLLAAGDEGKLRIRPGPVDVAGSLKRLARNWESAASKGEIVLAYAGPETCTASMDEAALETIVGNLVSNALKFTPPQGTVTLSLDATDANVTIRVRDTGPGIDPEFIPKLFGRFERSATAAAQGVRGTGIGLSLSKELVDLQGGTISVERLADPRGTQFEVVLPRHQSIAALLPTEERRPVLPVAPVAEEVRASAAVRARVTSDPEATILVAEDDPALAQHITDLLSQKYRVLAAPNGKVALEMAREHVPDLLVTDLEMPEMNGLELTRHFLALQGTTMSPVLIVSAHAGLGERLAGFEAGAVDYVLKPFSADELLARIRSQLALRKLALKLHESQKLAAMGMLSAGLAHEIRNPANALVNALEPLIELLPAEERASESTGGMLADLAMTAASQIRERCRNILDYSRSEQVNLRAEDLRVILRRARRLLLSSLAEVDVREDIHIDVPVHCAGPLVEQVLINLLDNAAYAAGTGGWIQIAARVEAQLVVIEISDSGPGVPVHLQERIFDPFFTTKPVGKGTGLGLTISRRIMLNHGGDLRVIRHHAGTAFRLELPLLT